VVSLVGVAAVTLGCTLVPRRVGSDTGVVLDSDLTELRLETGSELLGKRLSEADEVLEQNDAQIVGYVHKDVRLIAPHAMRVLAVGDVLVVEARAAPSKRMIGALGLALEEAVDPVSSRRAADPTTRAGSPRATRTSPTTSTRASSRRPRLRSSSRTCAATSAS
jgi:hypothetical protein